MASSSSLRREVLNLYKKILKIGRSWNAVNPELTKEERRYILNETRNRFLINSTVTDPQAIKDHVMEGEARLEMGIKIDIFPTFMFCEVLFFDVALHYKNPYPRPVNLPPKTRTFQQGKKQGLVQEKLRELSRPVYAKSMDLESGMKNKP